MQIADRAHLRPAIVLCLLVSAIVAASHMLDFAESTPALRELRNSLHAPAFALLAVVLFLILRSRTGSRIAFLSAIIGTALTALTGEFLQVFTAGDASITDLLRDAGGVSGALLLVAFADRQLWFGSSNILRFIALLGGLFLTGAILFPAVSYARAFSARAVALPSLISFDHDWESVFYHGHGGAAVARVPWQGDDNLAAIVTMGYANYSGLAIEPFPNWRGFTVLKFSVSSIGDQPRKLTLRIHDADHNGQFRDRFNREFEIDDEATEFAIPLREIAALPDGRQMHLDAVQTMTFFMTDTDGTEKIIIDDIKLLVDWTTPSLNSDK